MLAESDQHVNGEKEAVQFLKKKGASGGANSKS